MRILDKIFAFPTLLPTVIVLCYVALVETIVQYICINRPGGPRPLSTSYIYIAIGLVVWIVVRRYVVKPLSLSYLASKQRKLVYGRRALSPEEFQEVYGNDQNGQPFYESWAKYYGKLLIDPLLLRPSDTVRQLGYKWITYNSESGYVDREVRYLWHSELTVTELYDVAQKVQSHPGPVPWWRECIHLAAKLSVVVLLCCGFASINPVKYIQQYSWHRVPGELVSVEFTPFLVTQPSKLRPGRVYYVARCTYEFSYQGSIFRGDSVAEYSDIFTQSRIQEIVTRFYSSDKAVDVLINPRSPDRNAATFTREEQRDSLMSQVLVVLFLLSAVSFVLYGVDLVNQVWLKKYNRALGARVAELP